MSENDNEEGAPRSRLVIEFRAPGAVEFQMGAEGVSPGQVLAVAAWLDWYARRLFDQNAAAQAANRIVVPKLDLQKLQ